MNENAEKPRLFDEIEVLEARRIAELADDARNVRGRLLQGVREADLSDAPSARGIHNPSAALPLDDVLGQTPAYRALREAINGLPHEIQVKLWVTAQVGQGNLTAADWERGLATAELLRGEELAGYMLANTDLPDCLRKGLFLLGEATLPGDAS